MSNILTYNSFNDPHLQTYFENKNIQKHLRKIGLINRHRQILPSKQYQKEHRQILVTNTNDQHFHQLKKSPKQNLSIENQLIPLIKNTSTEEYRHPFQTPYSAQHNRPKRNLSHKNSNQQQEYRTISSAKTNHFIRTKSSTEIKSKDKDPCELTMIYLGPSTNLDYDQTLCHPDGHEILVMQQHCGGENLILFKNNLKPGEKFTFESRRHSDYPFALTLYVDGLIDCRISVCCEYKHKIGLPLTGKRASFAIVNIQGGQPCRICQFNEYLQYSSSTKQKSSEENLISIHPTSDHSNIQLFSYTFNSDQLKNDSNHNDEYIKAEEMYKELLNKLNDKMNWKELSYLEIQLGNICKEGLYNYDLALKHYLISLEIFCQHLSSYDKKLRNLYKNLTHLFLLKNSKENHLAIEYFQRIILIDYSINETNINDFIIDHYYLGLLYQNDKNYSQALFHLEKSLQFLIQNNFKLNFNPNIHFFQKISLISQTIYDKKALQCLSTINLSDLYFNLSIVSHYLHFKQNSSKYLQKALQLTVFDQNKFHFYQNFIKKLQSN